MIKQYADYFLGDGVLDLGNDHIDGDPPMRLVDVQKTKVSVHDALNPVKMFDQVGIRFSDQPYGGLEFGDPCRQFFDLFILLFFRQ